MTIEFEFERVQVGLLTNLYYVQFLLWAFKCFFVVVKSLSFLPRYSTFDVGIIVIIITKSLTKNTYRQYIEISLKKAISRFSFIYFLILFQNSWVGFLINANSNVETIVQKRGKLFIKNCSKFGIPTNCNLFLWRVLWMNLVIKLCRFFTLKKRTILGITSNPGTYYTNLHKRISRLKDVYSREIIIIIHVICFKC